MKINSNFRLKECFSVDSAIERYKKNAPNMSTFVVTYPNEFYLFINRT